jgi:hypothetical protein
MLLMLTCWQFIRLVMNVTCAEFVVVYLRNNMFRPIMGYHQVLTLLELFSFRVLEPK